jgi:two-component system NtrC family sensor kinase
VRKICFNSEVLIVVARALERTAHEQTTPQLISPKITLHLFLYLALKDYFDVERLLAVRKVSAAVINISGRQRMLCQRATLYALRLVAFQDIKERKQLRKKLFDVLALMEKSHAGLLEGDSQLNLPGTHSLAVEKIYFHPPYYLDGKMKGFIQAGRAIAQAFEEELTLDNLNLKHLLMASENDLLETLDAVVTQYQKEQEEEELAIDLDQAQLYQETRTAMAVAQSRSQELSQTLTELQNTQVQLIQAEKLSELGQLVAGVAHEINNPLGFICGNLDCAETYVFNLLNLFKVYKRYYPEPAGEIRKLSSDIELDFIEEDLPKLLDSMKMGAKRIQEIVLSLRNFSRLDQGKSQTIDLHECIQSTLIVLRYRFKHGCQDTGIRLIEEFDCLPPVECYSGQLSQALMNIVSNAIDALEESSLNGEIEPSAKDEFNGQNCAVRPSKPTIWIQTKLIQSENNADVVSIRIADNGSGMSEEVRQNLFKPFFTTKPVGKGTGLGLSISYQIVVERHRGSLECCSQLGQGTEFTIKIPLRQNF